MLGSLAKFDLEIARDFGLAPLIAVVAVVVVVVVVAREVLGGGGCMGDSAPDKLGFLDTLR